jgi:hypothetical protein
VTKRAFLSLLCALLSGLLLSCGGGTKNTTTTGSGNGNGNGSLLYFTSPTTSPVIESFGSNPTVNLSIVAPSTATITWTLQNPSLVSRPQGTLTGNGTSATYTAPPLPFQPPLTICTPGSPTYPTLQMDVIAMDNSGDSATMPITIIQTPPCIATTASIDVGGVGICPAGTVTASLTNCPPYPPIGSSECTVGSSTCPCPPPGSLLQSSFAGSSTTFLSNAVFRAGGYGSLQVNAGGGGQPPLTWSIASGSLPSGLQMVSDPTSTLDIFLAGTPSAIGCSTFTLQITDALGATSQLPYFVVAVPQALKVQAPNLYQALDGVAYPPTAFVASNGVPPYTWMPKPTEVSYCTDSTFGGGEWDLPPALSPFIMGPVAVISGTLKSGIAGFSNTCLGGYSIYSQVSDSQTPYPAMGSPSLTEMSPLLENSVCSQPGSVTVNNQNLSTNAFLSGTYAFLLRGFDTSGPVSIAGSIQMDGNGNITGGEEDVTRTGGSQNLTINPTGGQGSQSTYVVGIKPNDGCMVLTDSSGTTSKFAFTLGSCSNDYRSASGEIQPSVNGCGINTSQGSTAPAGYYTTGRVVEFDNSGTQVSGVLRMQNRSNFSSGLNGFYAFGLTGWDATSGHYTAAGSMQASASNFSSVAADIDDAGTLATNLTGGSGTIGSVGGTYGRATATLTVGQASYDVAVYLVDSNDVFIVTTDQLSSAHPILSGEAIGTTGPFSNASLQNSHIFQISGLSSTGPDVSIGVLHFDGAGTVTGGTVYEDQAGTIGSTTSVSANYTVDPTTGRTTFNILQGQTMGSHPFVAYIIPPSPSLNLENCIVPASCITGFLVGIDSTAQDGVLEFQTSLATPPPPFYNAFVLGDFAFGEQEDLSASSTFSEGFLSAAVIPSTSNNTGSLSGTRDTGYGDCWQQHCRSLIPQETFPSGAGGYTINSDGTGAFGGETVSVTNGRIVFYLEESPINLYPSVMVAEQ